MKRTGCWLLVGLVIWSVIDGVAATEVHSFCSKTLSEPWDTCVPDNIKVRDISNHTITCLCMPCWLGVQEGLDCASLSKYGTFPAARWIALRGIPIGNLSLQTLSAIHPSALTVLVLIDAEISAIENKTFARFSQLRSLHLDYNALPQLKGAWFSGLNTSQKSPAYLSISHNRISELENGCFQEISYLTMLDLSHNLLSEVASGWFRGLAFLHTLILSHNKIEVVSATSLDSLHDLRVLNLSYNPLTCLSERALSVPSLQTFRVSGERVISWEQDNKVNWTFIVDKTGFPPKQKVHIYIDNIGFCLTYSTVTKDFQVKRAIVDRREFKPTNNEEQEPGIYPSTTFGALTIRPPVVLISDWAKTDIDEPLSLYAGPCSEAWTKHDGITLALKDGVALKLAKMSQHNRSIALVFSYVKNQHLKDKETTTDHTSSKEQARMTNISCFVFRGIYLFKPIRFSGVDRMVSSECPDSNLPKYSTEAHVETVEVWTNQATAATKEHFRSTSVTTTLPTSKRDYVVQYAIPLVISSVLLVLALVMVYTNMGSGHVAQNVRDSTNQSRPTQSSMVVPNCVLHNTGLPGSGLRQDDDFSSVSANSYSDIKDEDVYDPSVTHAYSDIKDDEICDISGRGAIAGNNEQNSAAQNIQVALALVQRSHHAIDVTQLVSNPMYKTSDQTLAQASGGTDSTDQSTNPCSSILSTNDYSEIKDEDVYDLSTAHSYSEIKDHEVSDISGQGAWVGNSKLNSAATDSCVHVLQAVAQLSSGTDLSEQSTNCHSSVLSTNEYYEMKDENVYDLSTTHTYSEIKDG
ncbi:PREDICTED: uncharacterized protein LOC109483436 [Branchiostoma belcheri]|uniref:Uncharacterized protein LOC109483436 n=1 Tax=Branchiostoma belcheri TaxID=7741 RepID=A0A6P5A6Z2_BRABE|nr:PREDICTED: uncharacterized protein LOC109483436 [Branchiostoma belcheri]